LLSSVAYACGSLSSTRAPRDGDRYSLERIHATGGIGRVWLARDKSVGRDVALKELRPDRAGSSSTVTRFLKEAQITGQLEHPGIVPIYEVGYRATDDQPFYTMRFIRGRTLAEAVAAYHQRRAAGQATPMDLRELLSAFVGVCQAVAFAHSRGVLHRDLKPQNVALGDFGEVIVLDWGLARFIDRPGDDADLIRISDDATTAETIQGQVMGTPAYMPPEQAEGKLDQLGPASDVYGLGAILYQILVGKPPFSMGTTAEVLNQVIHDAPSRPDALVKKTPRALEAVCLKALAKKPADRYPGAKELAAEVQRWLADEPVLAYREPLWTRIGRWVKRHRVLVAGVAAAIVMSLVGLSIVLVLQAQSNRQLGEANHRLQEANAREQERFNLALQAIGAFHKDVAEDTLLKQDQFKDARDKLLTEAAGFYTKLGAALEGHNDTRSRRELGRAYYHLAMLNKVIGSRQEALRVLQLSLNTRREFIDGPDADADDRTEFGNALVQFGMTQFELGDQRGAEATLREALARLAGGASAGERAMRAMAHVNLASILDQTGRLKDAHVELEQALPIRQQLAAEYPDNDLFASALSEIFLSIGKSQDAQGQLADAIQSFQKGLEYQEQLVKARPNEPGHEQILAHHLGNTALVLAKRDQFDAALTLLEKALAIRKKMVEYKPGVVDFQMNLAWTGKSDKALAMLEQALPIRQKQAEANPKVIQFQRELAQTYANISYHLDQLGRPREQLLMLDKAEPVLRKLADDNPTVVNFQQDLAIHQFNLAYHQAQAGALEDSTQNYAKAIASLEKLVGLLPTVPEYQSQLGHACNNLANVWRLRKDPAESVKFHEKAMAIRTKLVSQFPKVPGYRNELASTHNNLGDLMLSRNKPDEARQGYTEAIGIREALVEENPKVPIYRQHLAASMKRLAQLELVGGEVTQAVEHCKRVQVLIESLPVRGFEPTIDLAGCQAMLSVLAGKTGSGLREEDGKKAANLAMELLQQAVGKGYRNRDSLVTDRCLDPLRDRPDFQDLMKSLEAKPKERAKK
jgi:serine/threonine-protein kinase